MEIFEFILYKFHPPGFFPDFLEGVGEKYPHSTKLSIPSNFTADLSTAPKPTNQPTNQPTVIRPNITTAPGFDGHATASGLQRFFAVDV